MMTTPLSKYFSTRLAIRTWILHRHTSLNSAKLESCSQIKDASPNEVLTVPSQSIESTNRSTAKDLSSTKICTMTPNIYTMATQTAVAAGIVAGVNHFQHMASKTLVMTIAMRGDTRLDAIIAPLTDMRPDMKVIIAPPSDLLLMQRRIDV